MAESEDTADSSWYQRNIETPLKEKFDDLTRFFRPPRQAKPEEPADAVEAIVELSRSLARDGSLDQPSGPTSDCFSARRWSDFLYDGLFGTGLDHLLRCPSCRSTSALVDVPQIPPPQEFAKRALEIADGGGTPAVRPHRPRPLTGILARSSRRVPVRISERTEISLKFLPAFDQELLLDVKRFALNVGGALTAATVSVDRVDPTALRLTFHANLSPQLRADLAAHASATGRVEITGSIDGRPFAAQCSLEFQNAAFDDE